MGSNQQSANGETISHAFSHGDDVRTNAQILMSKELAATAITTLNLVTNQDRSGAFASSFQSLGKLLRGHTDAAYTLNALQDTGTYISLRQFGLPGFQIIQRQEGDVTVTVDGSLNLLVIGHFNRQRRTAVESLVGTQNALPACLEGSQFKRIFISLSTAVDQEQAIIVVTTRRTKQISQLLLQRIHNRV